MIYRYNIKGMKKDSYILNPPAVHGVILSFQFTHVMPVEAFRMEPLSVWAVPYSGQYGPLCRMQGGSV